MHFTTFFFKGYWCLARLRLQGSHETKAGPHLRSSQSGMETKKHVAGDKRGACAVAEGRTSDSGPQQRTTLPGRVKKET